MTITDWLKSREFESSLAVQFKVEGEWKTFKWSEYIDKIISAAFNLKLIGLTKKDHIGLMSATRWEWAALDMAILASQAVTVPMYPNLSDDDLTFIINQSDIKILIIEDEEQFGQVNRIKKNFDREIKLIRLGEIHFDDEFSATERKAFFTTASAIKPKDRATIVYTSGTTGQPKGAVLLHSALVSEVVEAFDLFGIKPGFKSLTFLPFAHVLGRIEHWGSCYRGYTIAYAESIEKIKSNLLEIQPDFLIAVPRIFEKVYAGIMSQVESQPIKQQLFSTAIALAKEVVQYRQTKQPIPWKLLLKYEAFSQIAFSGIKKAFGGNLKFAVSGGAPLSPQMADFFSYCGINILEGYGLTETCAAVCVNQLMDNQPGTVGRPIGDVEIKFADDGEILVKSKKCFVEYYKNPEATKETLANGFFSTGDIGEMTERGFLKITDRKKDLIKTAGGKYVAPQKLEGLLKQDPLVSHVLIHGDQKKFVSALISIDDFQLKQWAETQQIKFEDIGELFSNPVLKLRLQKLIQTVNSNLASFESIKKFELTQDPWTVENGCLTQSLKVKRKFIEKKYAELITEMYE